MQLVPTTTHQTHQCFLLSYFRLRFWHSAHGGHGKIHWVNRLRQHLKPEVVGKCQTRTHAYAGLRLHKSDWTAQRTVRRQWRVPGPQVRGLRIIRQCWWKEHRVDENSGVGTQYRIISNRRPNGCLYPRNGNPVGGFLWEIEIGGAKARLRTIVINQKAAVAIYRRCYSRGWRAHEQGFLRGHCPPWIISEQHQGILRTVRSHSVCTIGLPDVQHTSFSSSVSMTLPPLASRNVRNYRSWAINALKKLGRPAVDQYEFSPVTLRETK
jgi:hypothetical protein